jgi:hypothetical protein
MGGAVQDPFYTPERRGVELNGRIVVGSSDMTRALQTSASTALAAGTAAVVMAPRFHETPVT